MPDDGGINSVVLASSLYHKQHIYVEMIAPSSGFMASTTEYNPSLREEVGEDGRVNKMLRFFLMVYYIILHNIIYILMLNSLGFLAS